MRAAQLPVTPIDLRSHIRRSDRMEQWNYRKTRGARRTDIWQFWLAGSDPGDACVSYEHGTLWVNLDHGGDYCFVLERLHEDWPRWSWHQQVEGKSWASAADLALIDALVDLFPVARFGPQPVNQGAPS